MRFSNLLMYDRQTESWWQQAIGQAIIGQLTGTTLVSRPAALLSWATFKMAHPDRKVLSRDTGYDRPYGQNPYQGYDHVVNDTVGKTDVVALWVPGTSSPLDDRIGSNQDETRSFVSPSCQGSRM